ncbi:hypothetical protein [Luteibacter sp. CQ10]|uniref:hypothetical protein n=1 Tax=Luteibacter sp. CQ10 TaxID=2805821 RepID=UPI0034A3D4B6
MTMTMRRFSLGVFCLLASPAFAGTIRLEPGGGAYVDQLAEEARIYTDALHSRLARADAADVRSNGTALGEFRRQANNYTVSRFDYTYEVDGVQRTIVIHGRSGKPLDTTVNMGRSKILSRKSSSTGSSDLSDGGTSTSGSSYEVTEAEVAKDVNDAAFYPADDPSTAPVRHVRATFVRRGESDFEATAGNAIKANDAELKSLRYLDREIRAGALPRGGRLTGIVSKAPCVSCSENIGLFAEEHDVNGTIRFLVDPASEAASGSSDLVTHSREASDALRKIRTDYSKQALSKDTSWSARPVRWHAEPSPPTDNPASILPKELCE